MKDIKHNVMFKVIVIFIFFLINHCTLTGLTIFAKFDTLINRSDLICIGTIIKGETVKHGAIYSLKIEKVLKGDKSLKKITIGKYLGKGIGNRYLLLLISSSKKNYYQIFFEGMSTFEILYDQIDNEFYDCIEIPHDIIEFKSKFKKEKIPSNKGLLWNSYLYKLDDIVGYINKMVKIKYK